MSEGIGAIDCKSIRRSTIYANAPSPRAFIRTHGGRMADLSEPDALSPENHVWEVAHALSHLWRFTGHCRRFYSVAQHAVNCSHLVLDPADENTIVQYDRLHHDDAEAYYGDMSSPLKRLPELQGYRNLEARAQHVAGGGWSSAATHAADSAMCRRELYDLFDPPYGESDNWVPRITRTWWPMEAEIRYLFRHFSLLRQLGEIKYLDGDTWRRLPSNWQIIRRVIAGRF